MSAVDKVRVLDLPPDQYVVIGSGLLDAWGLRESHDVDLVVSEKLFATLARTEAFTQGTVHGDRILTADDYEIFDNWGEGGSFEELFAESIIVDGVRFVSPSFLIAWKKGRDLPKDRRDIALLEERLAHGN